MKTTSFDFGLEELDRDRLTVSHVEGSMDLRHAPDPRLLILD